MPLIFFELLAVLSPGAYLAGTRICEFFLEHPDLAEDLISFLLGPAGATTPTTRLQSNSQFQLLRLTIGREGSFGWTAARRMAAYWRERLSRLGGNRHAFVEAMREELGVWRVLLRGITQGVSSRKAGDIFLNTLGTRFLLLRKRPVVVVPVDIWNRMNVHERRHFEAAIQETATELPLALMPLTRLWQSGRIEAITIARKTAGGGYYFCPTHL